MSSLQSTAPHARRRLAIMLAPIAVVLLIAGVLPLAMRASIALKSVAGVILAAAVLLVLVLIGLIRSAATDEQCERREAAIRAAVPPCASGCPIGTCKNNPGV